MRIPLGVTADQKLVDACERAADRMEVRAKLAGERARQQEYAAAYRRLLNTIDSIYNDYWCGDCHEWNGHTADCWTAEQSRVKAFRASLVGAALTLTEFLPDEDMGPLARRVLVGNHELGWFHVIRGEYYCYVTGAVAMHGQSPSAGTAPTADEAAELIRRLAIS